MLKSQEKAQKNFICCLLLCCPCGHIKTVGPNKALVISGGCCKSEEKKYIIGGWGWVWNCIQDYKDISLEIMTLLPSVRSCETLNGVPVAVNAVAQVKIMQDEVYLKLACEQFLGRTEQQIMDLLLSTFEGHLRAIIGTMEVESIFKNRDEFALNVREVATMDVANMGIKILSFTIKELSDAGGYLDAIGMEQTALVKSRAQIEETEADRDAYIKEQECQKLTMDAKYSTDTEVADFRRNFETDVAVYATSVNTAEAESNLAYKLQSSKEQQTIIAEELGVELVEKRLGIQVEEQEIIRAEKELHSTIMLPADADAFKTKTIAEGKRMQKLLSAEGDGQHIRLIGKAEATSIEAIGKAEALEMELKAAAYYDYGNAAIMRLVLDAMPKLAAEISAPLAKITDITLVGGSAGGGFTGQLTGESAKMLAELPVTVKAVTGYDITGLLGKIPGVGKLETPK